MDIIGHALIGANSGLTGIIASTLPDLALIIDSIYQLITGRKKISDVLRENHSKEQSFITQKLLHFSKIFHSWYIPIFIYSIALLFNLNNIYIFFLYYTLHILIDHLTHEVTYPLYPFSNIEIYGLINWSSKSILFKSLNSLVLILLCFILQIIF